MTSAFDPGTLGQLPPALRGALATFAESFQRLAGEEFVGSAADGEVTATADVFGNLRGISIGVTAKRELDNLTLGDAVVSAIADAHRRARTAYDEVVGAITLFGIPVGEVRNASADEVSRVVRERLRMGDSSGAH